MDQENIVYHSANDKTEEQAKLYIQTHEAPHRYLAYKDLPLFLKEFVKGSKALDYGSGTGSSTSFLFNLGFNVIGADISVEMLKQARINFPLIKFLNKEDLLTSSLFNFIFSSFVLLELASKKLIIKYLSEVAAFLENDGIFIAITGSEYFYSNLRTWTSFETNFEENKYLHSGDIVKVILKEPRMEFYDYYWNNNDYIECFKKAGLEIIKIHHPIGSLEDPYIWKDEMAYSPFTIFIAKKSFSN